MSVQKTFELKQIGQVRRDGDEIMIEIDESIRPALRELEFFSHVMVFWWGDKFDTPEYRTHLLTNPPYAPGHESGIFATRSPIRPNPILMTTCRILKVDEAKGVIKVDNLDVFDGTAVVDVKAYFPVCDRVQTAYIPEWLEGWPEWLPEEGIGLMPGEE